MLEELRVENLLLIEKAQLRLGPGLNVLTGETGAGKTVLAHALDLLLGGKPRAGIVRPGELEAYVEGVFVAGGEEVVLARRVWAEGRTRAYVNGRSATAADLQEIGGALLTFYGQHEHRRLTLASAQLAILDGFCGTGHGERLGSFAAAYTVERALAAELEELRERAGARERELDLLEWELNEIEAAAPTEAEEAELLAEREKLRHATALASGVDAALAALDGGVVGDAFDDGGGGAGGAYAAAGARGGGYAASGARGGTAAAATGALDALAGGSAGLEAVAGVDPALDALAARLSALALEADDLAGEFRRYAEGVDAPPGRLDAVEERLALLDRLKRKHGGSIAAVLEYGEQLRARREQLTGAEEALAGGDARLADARAELARIAGELRKARRAAAKKLAVAVVDRLADLAMEGATFEARVEPRADGGYGPSGADEVEFVIAPNPGVPAGPLRDIASGGELSRVMLALMSVAADTGGAGVLVFDEIDAGIGGQTARAVGERLRDLAAGRQVIAITHLPQIASLANRHFRIAKDTAADTALTTVSALAKGEVVGELVRMLGAESHDDAARRHAKELLKAA